MKLIICLGGTGQLVLHYYLQWYFLGLTDPRNWAPLTAIVIDPDAPSHMASLRFAAEFFERMCPHAHDAFGRQPSWIRIPELQVPTGGSLEQLFTGGDPSPLHPARAFFDRQTLAQTVNVGLYGRPAIAPSLWQHPSWGGQAKTALNDAVAAGGGAQHVRAAVVGSLLGGTGGGLVIPVLDHLIKHLHVSHVNAVLLGPYFECSRDQAEQYGSNWMALGAELRQRYQEDGSYRLRRLALLGASPSNLAKRHAAVESKALNLPWPRTGGEGDPIAEACWALADSLNNMVPGMPHHAEAALVSIDKGAVATSWERARAQHDQAMSALAVLFAGGTLHGAAADPYGGTAYGKQLLTFLRATLGRHAQAQGAATDFWDRLEREVALLWSGGAYTLQTLYPPGEWRPSRHEFKRRVERLPELALDHVTTRAEVLGAAARGLVTNLLRT